MKAIWWNDHCEWHYLKICFIHARRDGINAWDYYTFFVLKTIMLGRVTSRVGHTDLICTPPSASVRFIVRKENEHYVSVTAAYPTKIRPQGYIADRESAGKSRVQPATSEYSRISIAPPPLSCGYTYIKGHPLIKLLINPNRKAIRALSIYIKKNFT